MRIDGKAIADAMIAELANRVKTEKLTPTLAVILVGNDPESLAYIHQKQKAVERIGGKFIFEHLPKTTTQKELTARIIMYNRDPAVRGLIVQRPIMNRLNAHVDVSKDVDGLEPGSKFEVPIAMAVFTLLKNVDIQKKTIVIIGRGETAGKPIAEAFSRYFAMTDSGVATIPHQCATFVIHSTTPYPEKILKTADIIISCVGKKRVVTADTIQPGVMVISVGLWRDTAGKLHGDYEEDEIQDIAACYTPTPGGVGPVNIACLMQNLVKASTIKGQEVL